MRTGKIGDMHRGWFVGNFDPSVYKTNDCEVAVKSYGKGEYESEHYHKIATEITVVVKGKVRMRNQVFSEGDIVIIEPGETTDFVAMEDSINVVVKLPGANDDKYDVARSEEKN